MGCVVSAIRSATAVILVSLIAYACTHGDKRIGITTTRRLPAPRQVYTGPVSSEVRFGYAPTPQRQSTPRAGEGIGVVREWATPEGWRSLEPSGMRLIRFAVGNSGSAECYVSILRGPAGGVAENINRWRAQMGQAPLSVEAITDLPKITVLSRASTMVEIPGTYHSMSGETREDFLLVGMVCPLPEQTLFVKLLGPEAEVRPEAGRFAAFCESLR